MVDARRFTLRLLREWLASSTVLVPTFLTAIPFLGAAYVARTGLFDMEVLFVGGIATLGVAALAAAYRWFTVPTSLILQTHERLQEEDAGAGGLPLVLLERRLRVHGDAAAARLAGVLHKQRDRLHRGLAGEGFTVPPELAGTAKRLDDASFRALERSARIHEAKADVYTEDFRARLAETREDLLAEITAGVDALGTMLDHLQTRELRRAIDDEIPTVTAELDAGLAVAERVEARMASLEHSLRTPADAEPGPETIS